MTLAKEFSYHATVASIELENHLSTSPPSLDSVKEVARMLKESVVASRIQGKNPAFMAHDKIFLLGRAFEQVEGKLVDNFSELANKTLAMSDLLLQAENNHDSKVILTLRDFCTALSQSLPRPSPLVPT